MIQKGDNLFKIFLLIPLLLTFNACFDNKEDIKIGFVAGLSGKYSSLGTNIRDGFILGFDEIDNTINGQKIKIIQKDDKQDAKEAKLIIDDFVKNDIRLIVGNATSSMTEISLPVINKQKDFLLFSPTASSSKFTAMDDNFIRLQVEPSEKRYKQLNKYLKDKNHKNIYFIYDSRNSAYTKDYDGFFQKNFISNGGNEFVGSYDLNEDYESIVKDMKTKKYDLILVVGNSIDSANIIQYIRLQNIDTKVLISGWAKTDNFIKNGGKAIENVIVSTGYDDNSKEKPFLEFVKKFKNKYGKNPSVFSAQGYELAQIIISNLKSSDDLKIIKQNILKNEKYSGLQGDIIFDKNGDIFREYFMMKVENKKFIKIN